MRWNRLGKGEMSTTLMSDASGTIVVRDACRRDWRNVQRLLGEAGLPVADLGPDRLEDFLVAERTGTRQTETLGIIGLQRFNRVGLLRSLVVDQNERKSGLGRRLVTAVEANASCKGVKDLWLLTIDAERYFEGLGYKMMSRNAAPDSIRSTEEFSGLCPDGAYLMHKILE